MTRWSRDQWQKFAASYDAPAAAVQSSPGVILIAVGSVTAGILAIGYLPGIAASSQFRVPFVPILFACLGALCSFTAWRHKATGRIGTLCMLLDTLLYSSTFSLSAVLTSGRYAVGFAIGLALFLLGFPARVYSFTWLIAMAMCGPPLLATALGGPDSLVTIILWLACTVAIITTYRTGQRRALLAQNEQLRSALGAADRLADQSMEAALAAALLDIGHFLHELRNTRAAFQANLQFIQEEGNLQGDARAALEEAIVAQDRENELVAAALDRLRRKGRPQLTDFVLQDVLGDFARNPSTSARVSVVDEAPRFQIQGDPEHVTAILMNLARNAEKAGASEITIRTVAQPDAKSIGLHVLDNGPGLGPEILSNPFRPFAEGGRIDGSGLGLYLTRRYVDLLGGQVEASNSAQGGASFQVTLPGRFAPDSGTSPPGI